MTLQARSGVCKKAVKHGKKNSGFVTIKSYYMTGKFKYFVAALLIVVVAASFTTSYTSNRADFSGTWQLNVEKSDLGNGGISKTKRTKEITQTSDQLIIRTTTLFEENPPFIEMDTLFFDGVEHLHELIVKDGGRKRYVTTNWTPGEQEIDVKMRIETQLFELLIRHKQKINYKLSDDGKTLSILSISEGERGEDEWTEAYDKQ